jgi:benzylsuccinate CoA-transferase BbsF subunit
MTRLPLEGIRVFDMSWVGAGPLCGAFLGTMGAEVIKCETAQRLDALRTLAPQTDGVPGVDRGGLFNLINHNKKSCTLNLSHPKGVELAKQLIGISDVMIESFSAGMLAKRGMDYPSLRKVKPELIMVSVSALGRTGPWRDWIGYGRNLHALSGLSALIGYPGGPPRGLTVQWTDTATGLTAAFAVLAALHHRFETGVGQYIDLSMTEATAAQLIEPIMDYEMNGRVWECVGNRSDLMAPHNCYRCSGDDKWVAISVSTDEEWQALCSAMGTPELAEDTRFSDALSRLNHQDVLDGLINSWTRERSQYEVMQLLQDAGVCAGPCLDGESAANDIHLNDRGFYPEVVHPEMGKRHVIGVPWKLGGVPQVEFRPAPLLGEHNHYVFGELLHISADEISELEKQKVTW